MVEVFNHQLGPQTNCMDRWDASLENVCGDCPLEVSKDSTTIEMTDDKMQLVYF